MTEVKSVTCSFPQDVDWVSFISWCASDENEEYPYNSVDFIEKISIDDIGRIGFCYYEPVVDEGSDLFIIISVDEDKQFFNTIPLEHKFDKENNTLFITRNEDGKRSNYPIQLMCTKSVYQYAKHLQNEEGMRKYYNHAHICLFKRVKSIEQSTNIKFSNDNFIAPFGMAPPICLIYPDGAPFAKLQDLTKDD